MVVIVLRRIFALACAFLCLSFISCNFDPYHGKRPWDYGSAKWVCEDPKAWVEVDVESEEFDFPKGEVIINDRPIKFRLCFIHQTNQVFFQITEKTSNSIFYEVPEFSGECTFAPDKLVIKVDKDSDTVFSGKYDELVFTRNADNTQETD